MIITIKTLQQKSFKVEIDDSETVAALKKKIEEEQGSSFPASGLKLIYAGKILTDGSSISEYSIQESNFVVVMVSKAKAQPAKQQAASSGSTAPQTTTSGQSSATPQETSASEAAQPQAPGETPSETPPSTTTPTTTSPAPMQVTASAPPPPTESSTSQPVVAAPGVSGASGASESTDRGGSEATGESWMQASAMLVSGSWRYVVAMNPPKRGPYIASRTLQDRKPKYTCTVKVEGISKATSPAALERRLSGIGTVDVRLQECGPTVLANYAYVNCPSRSVAEEVVATLDNILVDGNMLRAKVKGEPSSQRFAGRAGATQPVQDLGTMKVLIFGAHPFITGEPLDEYFSQYGEVTTGTIVRKGNPDYAYINFRSPASAESCRAESPHFIQGVQVTAPPFKLGSRAPNTFKFGARASNTRPVTSHPVTSRPPGWGLHPGSNLTSLASSEYSCHPLVVSYVVKDANCYFETNWNQVKVLSQQGKISLYTYEQRLNTEIEAFMRTIISEHEAKVKNIEEILDCFYMPALVDESVQKKIREMKVPFEVAIKVQNESGICTFDTLGALIEAYSKSEKRTVQSEMLKKYFSSADDNPEYRWYWEDENSVFQPYDKTICQKLELFRPLELTIKESFGKYNYTIDTGKMLQTNSRTKTKRRVMREAIDKSGKYRFTIQISAHSDHISDIKREILEKMESILKESLPFSVPYFDEDSGFIDHLLLEARWSLVSADKVSGSGNAIILKGVAEIVKQVEVVLKEQILAKQIQAAKLTASYTGLKTPAHWEKQDSKFKLVEVPRETTEWNEIELQVKESGFNPSIVHVERIQNLWLWEIYEQSLKRMSDKNDGIVNEKKLFHGTSRTSPIKIYNSEQGFDSRLASKGLWGEGAYFAANASYSNDYAHTTEEGYKQIFLAQVLTGITCKSERNRSLKAPPKKSERSLSAFRSATCDVSGGMFEDERYDSVSGTTSGSEVFVIYEHGKVYPAYLITYKLSH